MSVIPLSAQAKTFSQRLFNETFYLSSNPDVLTAVSLGLTTAFEHFSTFGHRENRPLLPFFDTQAYLLANLDVLNATTDPGWVSAWNHFVLFGILEGRSPIGTTGFTGLFDEADYLAQNADVNTAVSNGDFRNGFEHYLLFGAKEGRAAFDKGGNAIDFQSSIGKTFTLTTGVDNIVGTSGNDTIIADNTGLTQLSMADTINGGAGIDTLKIYQQSTTNLGSTVFGQLTSVEKIYINNGKLTSGATLDVSGLTGVISIALDSPQAMADNDTFTLKTAAGQAVSLTNVVGTAGGPTSTFNLNGASDVTLNGVGTDLTLDLTSSGTALKLTTTGAASTITLANTGNALATLTVAGNKALDVKTSASQLKTVTSTATGDVTFDNTSGVVENYSGGAGRDILTLVGANVKNVSTGAGNDKVTIVTSALAAASTIDLGDGDDILILHAGSLNNLTSGAQLKGGAGTDRLVTKENSVLTLAQIAKINAASGFEVLGFATDGSGVNVANLTSINKFYVEGDTGVTISDANSNTQTTINLDVNNTQTITIANALFENSTTVVIDNQGGGSKTLTGLTVTGITNVALSSTGKSGSSNTITTLTNSDNTVVTITGDRDLTIGSLVGNALVGSKVDASAFTGKLTVTGSTKSDILIGGAGADTINGGAGDDTIIGGAGNDKITGGTGADKMTGGAGADTFVFVAGDGGAQRISFNDVDGDGKISINDQLIFGGAIDIITDFTSGSDKLDVPGSPTLQVATIGSTSKSVSLAANTVFTIRGTWDEATSIFTVSSTGSDTIALYVTTAGDFDTAQNIGNYVVLQGVTSVVAADFV